MPYPENATGYQVDSAETWTDFKKREVRRQRCDLVTFACSDEVFLVRVEALR